MIKYFFKWKILIFYHWIGMYYCNNSTRAGLKLHTYTTAWLISISCGDPKVRFFFKLGGRNQSLSPPPPPPPPPPPGPPAPRKKNRQLTDSNQELEISKHYPQPLEARLTMFFCICSSFGCSPLLSFLTEEDPDPAQFQTCNHKL